MMGPLKEKKGFSFFLRFEGSFCFRFSLFFIKRKMIISFSLFIFHAPHFKQCIDTSCGINTNKYELFVILEEFFDVFMG